MATPQAPPFSTRLPLDVQTAMEARLAKTGEKRNAMMVRLIRADLGLASPVKLSAVPQIQRPKYGQLLEKKGRDKWRT